MKSTLSLIQSWISESSSKVTVIPRINREYDCQTLLGITEYSALGVLINQVGGISIANNLIRHFGGENKYGLSIRAINEVENQRPTKYPPCLIVADDLYGGLFGINISLKGVSAGEMLYLPPDRMIWETMAIGHAEFVQWSMGTTMELFYSTYKSKYGTQSCKFNETVSFLPPMWIECANRSMQKISSMASIDEKILMVGCLYE
jgi:hypothetical protein